MDLPMYNRTSDNVHLVPDGLQQLMSDISREVLRSQPEDVYEFISDYLLETMRSRCLPPLHDPLGGYDTWSSSPPSTLEGYDAFSPSTSEVESYETFSSSTPETSVEEEVDPDCRKKTLTEPAESEDKAISQASNSVQSPTDGAGGSRLSLARSVSTQDTLVVVKGGNRDEEGSCSDEEERGEEGDEERSGSVEDD